LLRPRCAGARLRTQRPRVVAKKRHGVSASTGPGRPSAHAAGFPRCRRRRSAGHP
jgi:hypothetical protein